MATETDVGAWTLTNSGNTLYIVSLVPSAPSSSAILSLDEAQLIAAGGSLIKDSRGGIASISIPQSLLTQPMASGHYPTWQDWVNVAVASTMYSETIATGGLHTGVLNPGEVRYTTAYDASIIAQAGHTVLAKNMNINTGNKVAATQSNLKANTLVTYVATADGGDVVGSENLLIDGAGNTTSASDRMLCPFASQPVDVIPAYCNIVQTGNAYDLTVGTVTSAVSDRFVGTDATIPVQLDQSFSVTPYGTSIGSIPAMGSTSAYIKAHIQEARGWNNQTYTNNVETPFTFTIPGTPLKAEDLQYSETSSASGTIQQFTKVIHYQSGKSLMP